MTGRERLPARRASTSFDFEVAGLSYTATVSRLVTRIAELFLGNRKSNSLPIRTRGTQQSPRASPCSTDARWIRCGGRCCAMQKGVDRRR